SSDSPFATRCRNSGVFARSSSSDRSSTSGSYVATICAIWSRFLSFLPSPRAPSLSKTGTQVLPGRTSIVSAVSVRTRSSYRAGEGAQPFHESRVLRVVHGEGDHADGVVGAGFGRGRGEVGG